MLDMLAASWLDDDAEDLTLPDDHDLDSAVAEAFADDSAKRLVAREVGFEIQ